MPAVKYAVVYEKVARLDGDKMLHAILAGIIHRRLAFEHHDEIDGVGAVHPAAPVASNHIAPGAAVDWGRRDSRARKLAGIRRPASADRRELLRADRTFASAGTHRHVLRPQRQVGNAIEAQMFVSAAVSVSRVSSTGAITPDFPSAVMMRLIFIVKVFLRKKVRKAETGTVNTGVT